MKGHHHSKGGEVAGTVCVLGEGGPVVLPWGGGGGRWR
jgi:hypothetical protein